MTVTRDQAPPPESRSVALVTGATGAIGRAIATRIAAHPGHEVVLLCRDPAKAQAAVADIQRRTGNPWVRFELVDLSRHASIAALAERWRGPVHVLVNNAAIAPRRREETPVRKHTIVSSEAAVFEGCPFVGVDAYKIDQGHLFFGRQTETLHALDCFDTRPGSPKVRWLEINGNSG